MLNPVRTSLACSIGGYKGSNTWKELLSAPADLHVVPEKKVPWTLTNDIDALSESNPSWSEERRVIEDLRERPSIIMRDEYPPDISIEVA